MIQRIITAGYFDWKPQPEIVEPEPVKEPEVEALPEIHHQEVNHITHHFTSIQMQIIFTIEFFFTQQVYHSIPDERTFINSGFEYNESPAPLPTMPQVPQTTGYFPVDIE